LVITLDTKPVLVTKIVPLRGERAGLELFVLVDHCSTCEPGSKFEELRRFILSQPSSVSIGVAYIRNGSMEMGQSLTADHERAVAALSPPAGSPPSSPFNALGELIRAWPINSNRRVVLMISNGIDPAAPAAQQDPSAEEAIMAAQRAGVIVYAIYHPSADYTTSDFSRIYSGQVQLAHVAMETGGEGYFLGFGPLPSLAPSLGDVADHLMNQYLVDVLAAPREDGSGFQEASVGSRTPTVELMAPYKIWVSDSKPAPTLPPSGAKRP
jgi:hypothetical protein